MKTRLELEVDLAKAEDEMRAANLAFDMARKALGRSKSPVRLGAYRAATAQHDLCVRAVRLAVAALEAWHKAEAREAVKESRRAREALSGVQMRLDL